MSPTMTGPRRRTTILAAAVCLLTAFFVAGFAFPSTADAWNDRPKGVTGNCDHPQCDPAATTTAAAGGDDGNNAALTAVGAVVASSVAPAATTTSAPAAATTSAVVTTTSATEGSGASTVAAVVKSETSLSETAPAAASGGESAGVPFLTHYLVSPIAIGFFLIYGVSSILYRTKRIRMATHRKIWNVLLLASFLITGLFGIILTIQLDYRLPFTMPIDLLFWHVEAGIVMTLISLFHIGWHFNYYRNLVRKSRGRVRAAEAAERLRPAGQRRPDVESLAPRRDMSPRPRIEPET